MDSNAVVTFEFGRWAGGWIKCAPMTNAHEILLKRINERIASRGFCVLFSNDLAAIGSPEPAELRKLREKHIAEIEKFAAANGLDVEVRDTGLNATFRKRKPA